MKMFNVGDLVEGGFGLLHHDYGLGIIIQKKCVGSHQVKVYQIHWSNFRTTWESAKQLTLAAKPK
jgi:hypothetical protein